MSIQLIDFTGKVCYKFAAQLIPGNQKLTVNLPQGLVASMYHLHISTDSQAKLISKLLSNVRKVLLKMICRS